MSGIEEGRLDKSENEACLLLYFAKLFDKGLKHPFRHAMRFIFGKKVLFLLVKTVPAVEVAQRADGLCQDMKTLPRAWHGGGAVYIVSFCHLCFEPRRGVIVLGAAKTGRSDFLSPIFCIQGWKGKPRARLHESCLRLSSLSPAR